MQGRGENLNKLMCVRNLKILRYMPRNRGLNNSPGSSLPAAPGLAAIQQGSPRPGIDS